MRPGDVALVAGHRRATVIHAGWNVVKGGRTGQQGVGLGVAALIGQRPEQRLRSMPDSCTAGRSQSPNW
ncbi:MAG: hypothetical protein R3E79_56365 [Caldilineaceae bacterium]